jgi:hypothetical protein
MVEGTEIGSGGTEEGVHRLRTGMKCIILVPKGVSFNEQ